MDVHFSNLVLVSRWHIILLILVQLLDTLYESNMLPIVEYGIFK